MAFDRRRLRAGSQLFASEGFMATVFYRLLQHPDMGAREAPGPELGRGWATSSREPARPLRLNLNTATTVELEMLPGVDRDLARRAAVLRRQRDFQSIADFCRISPGGFQVRSLSFRWCPGCPNQLVTSLETLPACAPATRRPGNRRTSDRPVPRHRRLERGQLSLADSGTGAPQKEVAHETGREAGLCPDVRLEPPYDANGTPCTRATASSRSRAVRGWGGHHGRSIASQRFAFSRIAVPTCDSTSLSSPATAAL
jgi:hypothetical protein